MASSAPTPANGNTQGYINTRHTIPRVQKMKWTAKNDIHLLLHGVDREISSSEFQGIADSFPRKSACLITFHSHDHTDAPLQRSPRRRPSWSG